MLDSIKTAYNKLLTFITRMLSESDGTPSASRVLLFIFAIFTMYVVDRILTHTFALKDPAMTIIFISNLPVILVSLIGLMASAYTINKGAATFADIAQMISAAKQNKVNTELPGGISKDIIGKVEGMMGKTHSGPPPADQGKQ